MPSHARARTRCRELFGSGTCLRRARAGAGCRCTTALHRRLRPGRIGRARSRTPRRGLSAGAGRGAGRGAAGRRDGDLLLLARPARARLQQQPAHAGAALAGPPLGPPGRRARPPARPGRGAPPHGLRAAHELLAGEARLDRYGAAGYRRQGRALRLVRRLPVLPPHRRASDEPLDRLGNRTARSPRRELGLSPARGSPPGSGAAPSDLRRAELGAGARLPAGRRRRLLEPRRRLHGAAPGGADDRYLRRLPRPARDPGSQSPAWSLLLPARRPAHGRGRRRLGRGQPLRVAHPHPEAGRSEAGGTRRPRAHVPAAARRGAESRVEHRRDRRRGGADLRHAAGRPPPGRARRRRIPVRRARRAPARGARRSSPPGTRCS